jgi:hypothetical protein
MPPRRSTYQNVVTWRLVRTGASNWRIVIDLPVLPFGLLLGIQSFILP